MIKAWKLLLIVFVLLIGLLIINNPFSKHPEKKEKQININYSSKIVNNITFDRIKIYKKDNKYFFTARAINNFDKEIDAGVVTVKLDNYSFSSFIGDKLKPNEYKMIFMETKKDLSNNKLVAFSF